MASASRSATRFDFAAAEADHARGHRWVKEEPRPVRLGAGSMFRTAREVQTLLELKAVPAEYEGWGFDPLNGASLHVRYCLVPYTAFLDLRDAAESAQLLNVSAPDGQQRPLYTLTALIPGGREQLRAARNSHKVVCRENA
ncbi:MAG: hypothetical protein STHCBS139747_004973 [Sporothrix thermara]